MTVRLTGGRILRAVPCFQAGPYEENLRDKLRLVSDSEIHLQSFTSRIQCYAEDPTKAMVCEIEAQPQATLTVRLHKPTDQTVSAKLSDLIEDNVVTFTGVFTSESFIIHRLLSPSEYSATIRWQDRRTTQSDWYYVRVTQHNGQLAWSSPIWVG